MRPCVVGRTEEAREKLEGHDCDRRDRQDVERGALDFLLLQQHGTALICKMTVRMLP